MISFLYPVSRTKKIKLVRDLTSDTFEYLEINTDLNKRFTYKEGKITQSLYRSAIDLKIPNPFPGDHSGKFSGLNNLFS